MTLRTLLLARVRFLAVVAVAFLCIGGMAQLLGAAAPYPEHPFVSDAPVQVTQPHE